MDHLVSRILIKLAVYPAFYWIGFAVVKGLCFGKAIIMAYSALGEEEDAAWWEFRIHRWGFAEWRTESMIIIGGCFVLLRPNRSRFLNCSFDRPIFDSAQGLEPVETAVENSGLHLPQPEQFS